MRVFMRYRCIRRCRTTLWITLCLALLTVLLITAGYEMSSNTTSDNRESDAAQISPRDYAYIVSETNICKKDDKVYLLIIVCVAATRQEHRQTIRNTWASLTKEYNDVRLVFMLGKVNNSTVQASILNESGRFHDIIQEDFIDHYRNLTLKSIAVLKWTTLYCTQASYVMKVDDDVFVNIPRILSVLKTNNYTRSIIGGRVILAVPYRNKNSKWYVSKEQHKNFFYPIYAAGPCYIMSSDIVPTLYEASLGTPEILVKDVYVTGICGSKIGANMVGHTGFRLDIAKASGCWIKSYIAGHPYSLKDIDTIWNEYKHNCLPYPRWKDFFGSEIYFLSVFLFNISLKNRKLYGDVTVCQ